MAAFSGTAGSVSFDNAAILALISEWSFDLSMSPIETTEFGKEWDTQVPSVRTATGSFSGNMSPGTVDSHTRYALNKFLGGIDTNDLYLYDGTASWHVVKAKVTGYSPSVSVKGKGELSYQFTGEITTYA